MLSIKSMHINIRIKKAQISTADWKVMKAQNSFLFSSSALLSLTRDVFFHSYQFSQVACHDRSGIKSVNNSKSVFTASHVEQTWTKHTVGRFTCWKQVLERVQFQKTFILVLLHTDNWLKQINLWYRCTSTQVKHGQPTPASVSLQGWPGFSVITQLSKHKSKLGPLFHNAKHTASIPVYQEASLWL